MKVKVLNIIDNKTFKALSTTYKKHPRYGKYVTIHKKYLVDSAGKKVEVGQEVEIVSSRPLSKRKRWALKA
ncbi:MAG: 30S ribosomal protein S17 [Alphaproteobacteria bacterium RIFCSPLOWO2_01_FULL_40_26]|nr:MAG: 30S ribosomal protein S17 [Alphaproteobacteria bacterium RIFCSPHIGHO2_02_FULL_40_34]OFW87850.1 MAG: 30S ribosomal protein S17 [Alphaproteobacteria bacterium RIFCSPHIGHO2_01_FULL_40_8]OFW95085.1 MAG: 30S ribosomal protein S17 [Alphaproteobacteria bacterium RIFCSPLOWO2_01_FULL_40_26]OFX09092.1 MAG: 30S ribosomal protein S17 [Alphaproteobacteria bacterium RIFCSPLOWO2_02_FULL_40_19]OFX12166.1 MAG: 30S ribosomal protein S17 [Alphaproteobacteria bacterium RIFCSPLOWO2_12_FULL_40_11]